VELALLLLGNTVITSLILTPQARRIISDLATLISAVYSFLNMFLIPAPVTIFYIPYTFIKGLWNYKAEFAGDFSLWTENKNHGDDATKGLYGKRFFFFAEPQFWVNLNSIFAIGTKINIYYHGNTTKNLLEVYPTAAIRLKFR
jgi:hypothetical protein